MGIGKADGVSTRGDDPIAFWDEFNQTIVSTFSGYQLPVIELDQETPKEAVCTVFEKVNTGGVTLSMFELVTASFAADDFALRDDWDVRRKRMRQEFSVLRGIQGGAIPSSRDTCSNPAAAQTEDAGGRFR